MINEKIKTKNKKQVIYIEIEDLEKQRLKTIAQSKGLQLVPFCRMILMDYLNGIK